jgi:hypothetical protein
MQFPRNGMALWTYRRTRAQWRRGQLGCVPTGCPAVRRGCSARSRSAGHSPGQEVAVWPSAAGTFCQPMIWHSGTLNEWVLPKPIRFGDAETGKESNIYGAMCTEHVPFRYLFSAKRIRNRPRSCRLRGRRWRARQDRGSCFAQSALALAGGGNRATFPPGTPLRARLPPRNGIPCGFAPEHFVKD